jgi:hypothetical protein
MTKSIDTTALKLDSSIDQWGDKTLNVVEELENMNQSIINLNFNFEQTGVVMSENSAVLQASSNIFKKITEETAIVVSEKIHSALDRSSDLQENLIQITAQSLEVNNEMVIKNNDVILKLRSAWMGSANRLKGLDEQMESAFDVLVKSLGSNLDILTNYSNNLDDKASKAITSLAGLVQELNETIDNLAKSINKNKIEPND